MTGQYAKPDGTKVVADPEHFEGVLSDEPAKQKAVRRPISNLEAMRIARAHRNADLEAELEGEREISRQRANSIRRLRDDLSQANYKLNVMSRLQVGTFGTLIAAAIKESAREDVMPMVRKAITTAMGLGNGDVVTIKVNASDLRWAVPTVVRDAILECVARHGNAKALFGIRSVGGYEILTGIRVPELHATIPVYTGPARTTEYRCTPPPLTQRIDNILISFEPLPLPPPD